MRLTVLAFIGIALAACTEGRLGPSQALNSDPLLRDLPADSTFVARANLRLLRQSPLFAASLEAAGIDLDSLDRSLHAQTGLRAEALGDLRLGCGGGGCAALVAGDLSGFSTELAANAVNRVAERVAVERPKAVATAQPDLSARLPRGEPVALRMIAPNRALFGDQAAVTTAAELNAPGLDLSALAGAVPAGDLWMAMRDANLLFEQVAARLEQNGTSEALQIAERLRAPAGPHRNVAEMLQVVAFALDSGDPTTARARATCRSTTAAVAIEQMARAALLRVKHGAAPEAVRRAAADATVVRVGQQVEISLTWNVTDVLAAIEQAREVRP